MEMPPAIQLFKEDTESMSITLRATNASNSTTPHSNRRIVLTRARPSISIGRASKVTSKGFVAADSNGYFDSPVMSRQHAELLADFEKKRINIKDSGSLHGTFHTVNDGLSRESKLEAGKAVEIKDQDRLRFGIDIFRSNVTFPPTILTVELGQDFYRSPVPGRTTNQFCVPEDIDSEDDMFSHISDDISIVETRREPEPIDLTDDSTELRNIIDLTAERERFPNVYDQTLDLFEIDEVEDVDEINEVDDDSIMSEGSVSSESIDYGDHSSEGEDDSAPYSEIDDESDDNDDDAHSHTSSMHEDDLQEESMPAKSTQLDQAARYKSPSDFIFQSPTDAPAEIEAPVPQEMTKIKTLVMEAPQMIEVDLEPSSASDESAWTNSGVGFINNPNAVLPMPGVQLQEQLPVLDETSAFTYEQSKAAGQTVRRLLISDLLSQPQNAGETGSTAANVASEVISVKRSFEDAFPVDEVEKAHEAVEQEVNTTAFEANQQVVVDRKTLKILSRRIATPIPKRRRIVEVAACLALGGAGVLSALIYTAPSFA